jgi:hypothetical protein
MQCQGQRGILEMRFPHLGKFMFHAHQSEFTELGWMGFFERLRRRAAASSSCDLPGGALMEAQPQAPGPSRAPALPAWLLGLVRCMLADGGPRRPSPVLGGAGARRSTGRRPRGALGRAHRAGARSIKLTVRNDGPDRSDPSRRPSSTTPSWTSTRSLPPSTALRATTVHIAYPWIEARPTRSAC